MSINTICTGMPLYILLCIIKIKLIQLKMKDKYPMSLCSLSLQEENTFRNGSLLAVILLLNKPSYCLTIVLFKELNIFWSVDVCVKEEMLLSPSLKVDHHTTQGMEVGGVSTFYLNFFSQQKNLSFPVHLSL